MRGCDSYLASRSLQFLLQSGTTNLFGMALRNFFERAFSVRTALLLVRLVLGGSCPTRFVEYATEAFIAATDEGTDNELGAGAETQCDGIEGPALWLVLRMSRARCS